MRLRSIHQVFLDSKRAVRRFPFVLLSALAGVIAVGDTEQLTGIVP
jgi:hypothetical protein